MFKFENYPQLVQHHLEYEKLNNFHAKLVDKENDTEEHRKKTCDAYDKLKKFEFEIYSKAICDVFCEIKPKLTSSQGEVFEWGKVFGKPFNELNITEKSRLICMVEEEGARPYRLPEEYYDGVEWEDIVRIREMLKEIKKLYIKNQVAFSKEDEDKLTSVILRNGCHAKNIDRISAAISEAYKNDIRKETFVKLVQLYSNYLRR